MRIAALYDIHGNLPALEAVLEQVQAAAVDLVVVGGDVVPGPMPRETIACLLDSGIPTRFIHGNGDRAILGLMRGIETAAVPERFLPGMRWVAARLDATHEQLFAGWPPTLTINVRGIGTVMFCHATPRNDTEIFTRRTPESALLGIFDPLGVSLVVCGHTHMQFDRMIGSTRVVNAGSVGMPFGDPGAYWALLGPDVELKRTAYDLDGAAARIRLSAHPDAADFAANNVLQPPSEQVVLDGLASSEIKPS